VVSALNKKEVLKPLSVPANFVAPAPKKSALTLGGLKVISGLGPRPKKPLILYEYEASSECRRVREACSLLDIIVECRPCPGTTSGYADQLSTATLGKRTVPYLIDNNPAMYRPQMTGATEIVTYLFDTYGPGAAKMPSSVKGSMLDGLMKSSRGASIRKNARSDNIKMKAITLYGWEGAQYVKQVRETLTELGLAHVMINCADGSVNRFIPHSYRIFTCVD
jgi:hypothetical protein